MKTNADQPVAPESKLESKHKDPESKQGLKPDAKDDLKSLPMPEVEKKLGSSPDGLSQAEAHGPRNTALTRLKKGRPIPS